MKAVLMGVLIGGVWGVVVVSGNSKADSGHYHLRYGEHIITLIA